MERACRSRRMCLARIILYVLLPTFAAADATRGLQQLQQQQEHASDRVIMKLKRDTGRAMALASAGLAHAGTTGSRGAAVYRITDGASVADKVKQLSKHPAVEAVEPDYMVSVHMVANDEQLAQQWHLSAISAAQAWETTTGSAEVKVCVVDSGVQRDHPDLAPNILKGWNLVPASMKRGDPSPLPSDPHYLNYDDTFGHGTHIAGIIGAVGNNLQGVSGVNWNVKLLVCRFVWDHGSGYVSDAMKCISLCATEGAMITANSWGGIAYSEFLKAEIEAAQARGQLFVVSSGNTGTDLDATPQYPAAFNLPNMIVVGSTGASDALSEFSNRGARTVDIAAPGEAILSTTKGGGYGSMWGTSMAAPMVAGVAALLQARAQAAGHTLTYQQLIQFILDNGDRLPDLEGRVRTGSRVNAFRAVEALSTFLGASQTPLPAPPAPTLPPAPFKAQEIKTLASTLPCGTSPLKGARSWQSSTAKPSAAGSKEACPLPSGVAGGYAANRAVDGRCARQWTSPLKGSCAVTDVQDSPWWQAELRGSARVMSVGLTTRSDCGWADLAGAQVFVGNKPYRPGATKLSKAFKRCGVVPAYVRRSQRVTFSCAAPDGVTAKYVLVLQPKKSARLALCEVDVATQQDLEAAAAAAAAAATASRAKKTALG